MGGVNLVVGIPFQDEVDTIAHVYNSVVNGISEFFPDSKCVIVCVGAGNGKDALKVIREMPAGRAIKRIAFHMKDERLIDKVWSVKAIIEIANRLGSDLAIIDADLRSKKGKDDIEGLAPEWIYRLLFPVENEGFDLVIPKFNTHYLESSSSRHVICPLISTMFNQKVVGLPGRSASAA